MRGSVFLVRPAWFSRFCSRSFGIICTLKLPDTALLRNRSTPRILQYASLRFFPGALSPPIFPVQSSYPNLWWKRRYRWYFIQPVISILIQNWINVKLTGLLSRGALFLRSDIFTERGYCIFAESPPLDEQFLYTVLIVADEVWQRWTGKEMSRVACGRCKVYRYPTITDRQSITGRYYYIHT